MKNGKKVCPFLQKKGEANSVDRQPVRLSIVLFHLLLCIVSYRIVHATRLKSHISRPTGAIYHTIRFQAKANSSFRSNIIIPLHERTVASSLFPFPFTPHRLPNSAQNPIRWLCDQVKQIRSLTFIAWTPEPCCCPPPPAHPKACSLPPRTSLPPPARSSN